MNVINVTELYTKNSKFYVVYIFYHNKKTLGMQKKKRRVNGRVHFKGRESNKQLCSKCWCASSSGKRVKETSLTCFADLDLKELSRYVSQI